MLGEGEIIDCGGVGGGSYYLVHVVCWEGGGEEGLVIWYRLDAFLKGWVFVVFCYKCFIFVCLFVFGGEGGLKW